MQVLFPEEASLLQRWLSHPFFVSHTPHASQENCSVKDTGETQTVIKKSAVNSIPDTTDYS